MSETRYVHFTLTVDGQESRVLADTFPKLPALGWEAIIRNQRFGYAAPDVSVRVICVHPHNGWQCDRCAEDTNWTHNPHVNETIGEETIPHPPTWPGYIDNR